MIMTSLNLEQLRTAERNWYSGEGLKTEDMLQRMGRC